MSGEGGQCASSRAGAGEFCVWHRKQAASEGGLAHGRVDGPIPEAKLLEFEKKSRRRRLLVRRKGVRRYYAAPAWIGSWKPC